METFLLSNTTATKELTLTRRNPSQSQSTTCEISIGENISQAEMRVISKRVQVEKVCYIDVVGTKWVGESIASLTCLRLIDLLKKFKPTI